MTNDRPSSRHPLHAERESDGRDSGEPLRNRSHGETDGFDFFGGQGVDVADHASFEFGGDLRGAFRIGIDHADQFGAFHFTPDPGVVAAKFADADHCDSNGVLIHDFLLASDFGDSLAPIPSGAKA